MPLVQLMSPVEWESVFLDFCHSHPEGVTDQRFRNEHPEIPPTELVKVINNLSVNGLLELAKGPNGGLLYKSVAREQASILSQLEPDEKMVYVCIKAADNRGIWTKDLKVKTNLHQTVLNKVLKSLETGKRLIKAVRNVKNPTRKVYMLVGLTPSAEVTGGPWFSESELDVEFINELCRVCLRFIESRSPAPDSDSDGIVSVSTLLSRCPSLTDVHEFISSSGITSTELGIEDVRMLLNRLIYDGEVERVVRAVQHAVADSAEADENDDLFVYRALKMHGTEDAAEAVLSALSTVPCAACPVFDLCSEGAPISPSSCEYYKKWLSGFQ